MAKAYLTERTGTFKRIRSSLIPINGKIALVQPAITITTSASAQSAAFSGGTVYIDFTADAAAYYEIGANPTATANSARINANERVQEAVDAGQKIAFLLAT